MQPVNGPGAPLPGARSASETEHNTTRPAPDDRPLSPAQRTTLERLIVRIMSLSSLKSAELWAGLRHEVGVNNDDGLLARHFPQAEQFLNGRLTQVQNTHASRQLLQQLTDLLPAGNNRQAVSDFIRQQFGHTVLSSLTPEQLRQVLTMLQNGQITIPQLQQNHITDRTLLPAEHQTLNQQIARLAAATGEPPVKLWASLLKVVNLHSGDPVPSRFFPLLNQYLQASLTMSQHPAPTLHQLSAALKQPLDSGEQKLLEDYSQQRFNLAPQTPVVLTSAQVQDLLNLLFNRRADRLQEEQDRLLPASEQKPQPLFAPLWSFLPPALQPLAQKPLWLATAIVVVVLLLWLVI